MGREKHALSLAPFYVIDKDGRQIPVNAYVQTTGAKFTGQQQPEAINCLEQSIKTEPGVTIYAGHYDYPCMFLSSSLRDGLSGSAILKIIERHLFYLLQLTQPTLFKELALPEVNIKGYGNVLFTTVPLLCRQIDQAGDDVKNNPFISPSLEKLVKSLNIDDREFIDFFQRYTNEPFFLAEDDTNKRLPQASPGLFAIMMRILDILLKVAKPFIDTMLLCGTPIVMQMMINIIRLYKYEGYENFIEVFTSLLLNQDINIWQQHIRFGSFLHFAIVNENQHVVKFLETLHFLKVTIQLEGQDSLGRTPLMCAILTC